MEKYTDLKELLLAFLNVYFDRCVNDDEDEEFVINDFVANNSLALGKPEPLAKNKQTENSFLCYQETLNVDNRCEEECILCRNNRLENECRDATSR